MHAHYAPGADLCRLGLCQGLSNNTHSSSAPAKAESRTGPEDYNLSPTSVTSDSNKVVISVPLTLRHMEEQRSPGGLAGSVRGESNLSGREHHNTPFCGEGSAGHLDYVRASPGDHAIVVRQELGVGIGFCPVPSGLCPGRRRISTLPLRH